MYDAVLRDTPRLPLHKDTDGVYTDRYKYQPVLYQNEMSDESHNHVCGVAQRNFHGRFAAYVERWEQEREK